MKHVKVALFLGLLGLLAGAFIVPYQFESLRISLGEAEYEKIIGSITFPIPVVIVIASFQLALVTAVLGWIGLRLTERTGLTLPLLSTWILEKKKPVIDVSALKLAITGGAAGALLLVLTDLFAFQPRIPELGNGEGAVWWKAVTAGVLYGGIVEEVLVRLFLMTLIVWLLAVIFKKHRSSIPASFYWIAVILASLIFAAGHLPATQALFGELSGILVARALILNGVLGLFFGYLYWKKGLEYAMAAHMMVHIVTQLILLPVLSLVL